MPKIGVTDTDEQVDQKEGKEETFDHQEVLALCFPLFAQFVALIVCQHNANDQNQRQHNRNGDPCIGNANRASHPREITKDDKSQCTAEGITFIGKPRHGKPYQWIDCQAKNEDKEIPDDQSKNRIFVLYPFVIEQVRPCAACALTGESVSGQEQIGVIAELTRGEVNGFCQIHGAENGTQLVGVITRVLFKDQDFGMIVERESFLCGLVIDDNGTESRIRFKNSDKIETKTTLIVARFCIAVTLDDVHVQWDIRSSRDNTKW